MTRSLQLPPGGQGCQLQGRHEGLGVVLPHLLPTGDGTKATARGMQVRPRRDLEGVRRSNLEGVRRSNLQHYWGNPTFKI